MFRVVRCLPSYWIPAGWQGLDGQAANKPQGRKPRAVRREAGGEMALWGFESRQVAAQFNGAMRIGKAARFCAGMAPMGNDNPWAQSNDRGRERELFVSTRIARLSPTPSR